MSSLLLKVQNRAGLHFTFKPKDDITNDKEIWVRFFFYSRYNPYISLIQVLIRTKSSWIPAKGGLLGYQFLRNSCFWPPALFVIIMKMKTRLWEIERHRIYMFHLFHHSFWCHYLDVKFLLLFKFFEETTSCSSICISAFFGVLFYWVFWREILGLDYNNDIHNCYVCSENRGSMRGA